MKNNISFIWALFKNKLSNLMVYRLSFFGGFFVDATIFLIQLLVFEILYLNVDSIGGLTKPEMIVYVGTFSLINAISMVLFFFGVNSIPGHIADGTMDFYLTKPVNALMRLTFENINIGSIPLIITSIGIVVYGAMQMKSQIRFENLIGYIFYVAVMLLLYYDVQLIIRTIPFFVISNGFTSIEELLTLCFQLPGTIFKGTYKVIFYFILPYGIMATLPMQLLAGKLSMKWGIIGLSVVVVFTILTKIIWRLGIKNYKSVNS